MERLTHKARYEAGYKLNKGVKEWQASDRLGAYENTGLTPEEIMELKERDTAKASVQFGDEDEPMLRCPYCDENVTDLIECGFDFCPYCGGRWEG